MPPDRRMPRGTSDTSRMRTASERRSRSSRAADDKLKFVVPADGKLKFAAAPDPLASCDKLKFVVQFRSQYRRILTAPFSTTSMCDAGSLLTPLYIDIGAGT